MNTIGCKPVWYIGTMGFSYSDWESVFYPQGLKPKDFLSYYSRIFRGVEIDFDLLRNSIAANNNPLEEFRKGRF